jgi:hypothetical protein
MATRPVSIFVHSIIFMLALILTAGLINTGFPPFKTPQGLGDVSVKFKYFTDHKDDYDIIFLGPSITYHGIIPKLFDELMTANGNNVKSFNLGIQSANAAEMDFYLQKVLALKPAKLKWIFLDCIFDVLNENEQPTATKNIYWHTPMKTIENFLLMAESNRSLPVKIKSFHTNFISFFYRWFGIGDFSNFLYQREEVLENGISENKLLQEAGYYAIDWMDNGEKRKKFFLSNYGKVYQRRLEKANEVAFELDNISTETHNHNFYAIKMVKKLVDKIYAFEKLTQRKVEPIFLISPALHPDFEHSASAIMRAFDLGYIPTLFAFTPNNFASLYEMSNRIDSLHLNNQGAQEYTYSLAAKFSEYLKLSEQKVSNQPVISHSYP